MTASDEFAWDDVANHIVQQAVERVAIYSNPHGDVVIRGDSGWPEHDAFIVIARANALRAAQAILRAAGIDAAAMAQTSPENHGPKDPTGADERNSAKRFCNGQRTVQ